MTCLSNIDLVGIDLCNVFRGNVPLNTIVLDSGASLCLFTNPDLIQQLNDVKHISIHCGDTSFNATKTGSLCDSLKHLPLPKDWYYFHENGVANLLSLSRVAKRIIELY